jgi:hypothetical protein
MLMMVMVMMKIAFNITLMSARIMIMIIIINVIYGHPITIELTLIIHVLNSYDLDKDKTDYGKVII